MSSRTILPPASGFPEFSVGIKRRQRGPRPANLEILVKVVTIARAAISRAISKGIADGTPLVDDVVYGIPCPVCGDATLYFCRASYNGYVWGACDTDGCVSWME